MAHIPDTDLDVFPLCLGGNVFGWTADDARLVRGARRLRGGRRQLHRHGRRLLGVGARQLGRRVRGDHRRAGWRRAATASGWSSRPRSASSDRRRARGRRTSAPRPTTRCAASDRPHRPLLRARGRPRHAARGDARARSTSWSRAGKVRHVAASNYTRAAAAPRRWRLGERDGLAALRRAPAALQPDRARRVRGRAGRRLCEREGLACIPYFALARGFLTGKYRPGADGRQPARRRRRRLPGRARRARAGGARRGRRGARRRPSRPWRWPGCAAQPTVVGADRQRAHARAARGAPAVRGARALR